MSVATYPRCVVLLDVLMEDYGTGTGQSYAIEVIPRSVDIVRNDHRTADTARITLDLRDFPFDPRTFQSARVRVLLGDTRDPLGTLALTDACFVGFVDTPETARGEGGDTVTLECRDYTGVLLDQKWDGSAIDVTLPLQTVVDEILAAVPGAVGLTVGYSMGAAATVLATVIGRPKFAAQSGDDVWTVLCDLCGRAGLIPVFELDLLLILTPADFGVDRATFVTTSAIKPVAASFSYGRDLSRLGYRRRFKEARSVQVEVRAYDPTKRVTLIASYPPVPTVIKRKVSTTGKVSTTNAPILPYYVTGAYTPVALAAKAQSIWSEAARQEIELDFETAELWTVEGVAVPSIGNGTRLTVTTANSIATAVEGESAGEAVARLTTGDRALAADVAAAFVASLAGANNLTVQFYCKSATHSWSREQGYRCTMTAINYVGGVA